MKLNLIRSYRHPIYISYVSHVTLDLLMLAKRERSKAYELPSAAKEQFSCTTGRVVVLPHVQQEGT